MWGNLQITSWLVLGTAIVLTPSPGARKINNNIDQSSSEGRAPNSYSWLTLTSPFVNNICSHESTTLFFSMKKIYGQQYVLENIAFPSIDHCLHGRISNDRKLQTWIVEWCTGPVH
jgi:hypothetical protein